MKLSFQRDPNKPLARSRASLALNSKKRSRLWLVIIGFLVLLLIFAASAFVWYRVESSAVSSSSSKVTLTISEGMSPTQIGELLQSKGLIRNLFVYRVYIRLHNIEGSLHSGTYKISPSEDLASIMGHLTSGKAEIFNITFYPGATLYDPTDTASAKRTDVYTMLKRAGYSDEQIKVALSASYDSPLFQDKPSGTSLEGYVFGDTYQLDANASAKDVLEYVFSTFYKKIESNDIITGVKKQGLNLYQAITLASIVQKEASNYQDMRKISQVFLLRLKKGIALGSDVTYMYAASQANKTPTVSYDSPYNTRIHAGLPPGPISSPSIDALKAVADPAPTSYLYFVAGEDGAVYYSYTEAEHEANIKAHCGDLCN